MASAWGYAWGSAWGNAWGAITALLTPSQGGAVSRSKGSRKRVVVEVDGKQYVVPVEGLQEFLDAISKKAEAISEASKDSKVRKQNVFNTQDASAPVVKIISAPVEEMPLIRQQIDRTNEILAKIMQGALDRYLKDLEDEEEWLLLIL